MGARIACLISLFMFCGSVFADSWHSVSIAHAKPNSNGIWLKTSWGWVRLNTDVNAPCDGTSAIVGHAYVNGSNYSPIHVSYYESGTTMFLIEGSRPVVKGLVTFNTNLTGYLVFDGYLTNHSTVQQDYVFLSDKPSPPFDYPSITRLYRISTYDPEDPEWNPPDDPPEEEDEDEEPDPNDPDNPDYPGDTEIGTDWVEWRKNFQDNPFITSILDALSQDYGNEPIVITIDPVLNLPFFELPERTIYLRLEFSATKAPVVLAGETTYKPFGTDEHADARWTDFLGYINFAFKVIFFLAFCKGIMNSFSEI